MLEPLDFVLPKREPVTPVLDLSVQLSSSSSDAAEPPAPTGSPEETVPDPGADLNLYAEQPQETEPRPSDVKQNDPADADHLTSADDNDEPQQPLPRMN